MVMETNPKPDDQDPEARFLAAFEEYNDALFRHAFFRLSSREQAIDVVHDTFTKAWSYLRGGYEIKSFRPFLYKILNNLIIDEYRKKREESLDEMMEEEGVDESSFPDLTEHTVEALAATMDGKKAFLVLETLPEQYREVLILRFIDGLGPKEIAELTEQSESVVSVRLHRGLKKLRDTIERESVAREERRVGLSPERSKRSPKI